VANLDETLKLVDNGTNRGGYEKSKLKIDRTTRRGGARSHLPEGCSRSNITHQPQVNLNGRGLNPYAYDLCTAL